MVGAHRGNLALPRLLQLRLHFMGEPTFKPELVLLVRQLFEAGLKLPGANATFFTHADFECLLRPAGDYLKSGFAQTYHFEFISLLMEFGLDAAEVVRSCILLTVSP